MIIEIYSYCFHHLLMSTPLTTNIADKQTKTHSTTIFTTGDHSINVNTNTTTHLFPYQFYYISLVIGVTANHNRHSPPLFPSITKIHRHYYYYNYLLFRYYIIIVINHHYYIYCCYHWHYNSFNFY